MPKPQIYAVDYNTIRNKVEDILGTTGPGSKGYGQRIISEPVYPGQNITKAQWDNLAYDITSVRLHQTGSTPTLATINPGSIIYGGEADNPNINFDSVIELATEQRLNNAVGRTTVTTKLTPSYTSGWSTQAQTTFSITFSGYVRAVDSLTISAEDHARFFFNTGGKVRFTSTRSGGTSSSQNSSWTSLLNSTGTKSFEASVPGVASFYSLTDSWQVVYQGSASSSYALNQYKIEAKSNVVDNSLGGATVIDFRVTWVEGYVDPDTLNPGYPTPGTSFPPGDLVNGTLSLVIEESKVTGDLAPSGSFEMQSPTYSPASITAT